MEKFDVIATVVTFHNPIKMLDEMQASFFKTKLKVKLVFIDNSSNPDIKALAEKNSIEYITGHGNVGFGRGHNIGINKYVESSKYFLILNPDVVIEEDCLEKLFHFMEKHPEVPLSTPLTLNPDRSIQFVNKRLPTLKVLFARRFFKNYLSIKFKRQLELYTLQDLLPFNKPLVVPIITGCFMFFRNTSLEKLKGFDEVFFMYFEDSDISRRAVKLGPTIFYPEAKIIHQWERGSAKKLKLFLYLLQSAYFYFVKWGVSNQGEEYAVREFNQ